MLTTVLFMRSAQAASPFDPTGARTSEKPAFSAAFALVGPMTTATLSVPTRSAQTLIVLGLANVTTSACRAVSSCSLDQGAGIVVYVFNRVTVKPLSDSPVSSFVSAKLEEGYSTRVPH